MENITSSIALKNAIKLLEIEHDVEGQLLKKKFYSTYERFKPVNLIRNTFHEVVSSPHFVEDVIDTGVGMATGFVSKKIVMIGASGNIVRKLLGTVLQLGITTIVRQHPETIRSLGNFIFKRILRKKEKILPLYKENGTQKTEVWKLKAED